jgi:exodeoxyribonuclease VIII
MNYPRVNWSTLKAMSVSPKHYLHGLVNPRADTPALQLGRALHCLVYEPGEFAVRYAAAPNFNRACNDDTARAKGYDGGKQAALAWEASNQEREIIEADIYQRACGMRDALLADPVAGPLMRGGRVEHRIEWTDDLTGIECRGRVDHVNGCLSDLKSTRSLQWCERDAARLQYHAQLAWYSDGLEAAGLRTEESPRLVFVESEPPYDVLVLLFTEEDLAAGRRVYRACLDMLAECRKTGIYPGVSRGVARRIQLPEWALAEDDVELTLDGEVLL